MANALHKVLMLPFPRLGLYLQLLGMVYLRQGDLDTSFEYYQRALANYSATVGDHYYPPAKFVLSSLSITPTATKSKPRGEL